MTKQRGVVAVVWIAGLCTSARGDDLRTAGNYDFALLGGKCQMTVAALADVPADAKEGPIHNDKEGLTDAAVAVCERSAKKAVRCQYLYSDKPAQAFTLEVALDTVGLMVLEDKSGINWQVIYVSPRTHTYVSTGGDVNLSQDKTTAAVISTVCKGQYLLKDEVDALKKQTKSGPPRHESK